MTNEKQGQVTVTIKVDGQRADMIRKLFEEIDVDRAEALTKALDTDFDKKFEDITRVERVLGEKAGRIDQMGEHAVKRLQEILEFEGQVGSQFGMKDKPWSTGRYIWAAVSVILGGGLSWLCQAKLPALNHAASGVTGGLCFEKLGLRGQRSFIGAALGGLSGTWLKQNFELGEIALSTPAYAYTMFTAGEDLAEGFADWKRRRAEEAKNQPKK